MIYHAKDLSRNKQHQLSSPIRGIYVKGDYDLFDLYLIRYPSGVVTLETALSFYHLIDDWIHPPFSFCFKAGYRKINDNKVKQMRDVDKIYHLGVEEMKRGKYIFKIYNKERLLIELWRKKKFISDDIYKEALYRYRELARSGELNIPLIKEYINLVPKAQVFYRKLSSEVL